MARGVLGGMLAGGAVCAVAAIAISAVIGPPVPPTPDTATVEVTPGSGFQDRREDGAANLPAAVPQPSPGTPPAVSMPAPDSLDNILGADTDPGTQPQTGAARGGLSAPPVQGQRGRVEVASDAPVLPSPQASLPAAPDAEDAVSAPEPASIPVLQAYPDTAAPEVEDAAESDAPDQTAEPDADEAAPEDPVGAAAQPDEVPSDPPTPEATAEATPQEDAPQEDAPQPEDNESAQTEAEDTATQVELAGRPSIGRPATSLVTRDAAPDATGDTSESEAETSEDPSDLPPIQAFAATFENPEDKPLMSIVLIDRGEFPQIVEALDSFPYPISFAVDPAWDGAPEAMARYRAAGRDVLVLADMPQGAEAADVEVNLGAMLGKLPEAVAVMEGDDTGLQGSRAISDQVRAWVRDSGHGLVMYPQGLDTVRKLAEKDGVPAATLFRDFDAKGQDASVIRRFLDQAAFKAGQEEGGVIMVGRARPETISALILWGLADRAERVALAPVSALLQARSGQSE